MTREHCDFHTGARDGLTKRGWLMVAQALTEASSKQALVAHWFLTPADQSIQIDEHFGSNERTAKFLRVVVPTLADQLGASMLTVSVPWDVNGEPRLIVLLAALRGQRPILEARALDINPEASELPPWWLLGEQRIEPPAELSKLATRVLI